MNKAKREEQGFSLVELLTVIAIMAVLVGLSIPAIQGMRSTYNRKAAVDLVMSTIEQARVAAIQSGENTYVVMALAKDSGISPDAMMIVGDPPLGSTSAAEIFYTHWVRLPLNVRFRSSTGTLPKNSLPSQVVSSTLPPLFGGTSNYTYTGFAFDSTGTLWNPPPGSGPNGGLDIALYEGIRNKLLTETAVGASAAAAAGKSGATLTSATDTTGIYEVIRLSRYSGRSWADVSTLAIK
jgi:prepilin-type N-terminal cleavage/methylation domain-containing protein